MHGRAALGAFFRRFLRNYGLAARIAVIGRDAVAPPELAGNAPIADVFHPVIIRFVKALRHELDLTRAHCCKCRFCKRLHVHKPLFGNQRFHRGMAAIAGAHIVRIGLYLHEIARRVDIRHKFFAAFHGRKAFISAAKLIDMPIIRKHAQHRQVAPHAYLKIVGVMRRGNLYRAGAEFHLNVFIRYDGNLSPHHGDHHRFAHDIRIALIRRVYGNGGIAQDGFRARGCNGDGIGAIRCIVAHMPEMAVLLLIFHLSIRKGGFAGGAPVDDAVAAVDEPLAIELHKHLDHRFIAALIHGKALARPVARCAELFKLLHDAPAINAFPFPRTLQKCVAANVALIQAFLCHLLHDLHFRGNGCMVRAREPKRLISCHALVADEHILQRFIERMPHVELPRNVRWRNYDAIWRFAGIGFCMEVALFLPCFIKPVFHGAVVIGFGQFPVHWLNPPVSIRFTTY